MYMADLFQELEKVLNLTKEDTNSINIHKNMQKTLSHAYLKLKSTKCMQY